jgi:hypothetical protein
MTGGPRSTSPWAYDFSGNKLRFQAKLSEHIQLTWRVRGAPRTVPMFRPRMAVILN